MLLSPIFWSATQSHIYKSLEGLEKTGCMAVQVIQQEGKPNRKEYHITDDGRAELRRWLVTSLPMEPVREATMIQIFFSHFSTDEEIVALFEARMQEVRERLQPCGQSRKRRLMRMPAGSGLNVPASSGRSPSIMALLTTV